MKSTLLLFSTDFSLAKSQHILEGIQNELFKSFRRERFMDLPAGSNYHDLSRGGVVSYDASLTSVDYYLRRQVYALYQKNSAFDLGIDTREVAQAKFLECEDHCRNINRSITLRKADFWSLERVRRALANILGEPPSADELQFNFGPGANVGVSKLTSVRRKINSAPTFTPNARPLLSLLRACYPHWHQLQNNAVMVEMGKLAFVPKNAKTDRPICVEPLVNSVFQKGLGYVIRRRLRDAGIDLNSQAKNQRLARIGSRDGSFATLDLESASDTISLEVVRQIVDPRWFRLLYAARTPVVRAPNGDVIQLEKFSSMGNGYTFELESAIFTAVCRAVTKGDISVFGDDIVCPSDSSDEISSLLVALGFKVNSEKSFTSGPFRESCGRDFFKGEDIRPVYVKGLLSVRELFRLHNFFFRNGMENVCEYLLSFIPRRFRLYGPDGFGDGHLLSHDIRWKYSKSGRMFSTWVAKPFIRRDELEFDYESWLCIVTGMNLRDSLADPVHDPRHISYSIMTHDFFLARCRSVMTSVSQEASRGMFYERASSPRYKMINVLLN